MTKFTLKSLAALFAILFSFSVQADKLWVEKSEAKLHFVVYPSYQAMNYYAGWTDSAGQCQRLHDGGEPLGFLEQLYRLPEQSAEDGYLCIIRSQQPLETAWAHYEIKPETRFLSRRDELNVIPGEIYPEDLPFFEQLSCALVGDDKLKQCELKLNLEQ